MVIFTNRLDICADRALQLVSAIMVYEDVGFKTLSDRYTNSLTYRRSQSKFIFNKSSAKNNTHYGKSTVFFFHRKIGCNKLFPSHTSEV